MQIFYIGGDLQVYQDTQSYQTLKKTSFSFVEYSQSIGNVSSTANGEVILKPIVDNFTGKCEIQKMMNKLLRKNQIIIILYKISSHSESLNKLIYLKLFIQKAVQSTERRWETIKGFAKIFAFNRQTIILLTNILDKYPKQQLF